MTTTPPEYSLAWFESTVDTLFEVKSDAMEGSALAFRLVQVSSRPAPGGWVQFSAMFVGPPEPILPQGICHFAHPVVGKSDLFIVPVGRVKEGIEYQVCVARKAMDGEK